MDAEDPRPGLPNPRPSNPITDVELHEDSLSDGMDGAAHQVIIAGVRPPTPQEDVPAAADDGEVATMAKKILEFYKKAGMSPGVGSKTGEGGR